MPGGSGGSGGGGGGGAGVHDLAVDMGMDPETAALLRDVSRRKEAAVAAEEYELVRRRRPLSPPPTHAENCRFPPSCRPRN